VTVRVEKYPQSGKEIAVLEVSGYGTSKSIKVAATEFANVL
jgi:hypothetical protein